MGDSARLIVPPPLLYLATLTLGGGLHFLYPQTLWRPSSGLNLLLGSALVMCGAAFARWAFVTLHRLGTTANPRQPSQVLVTSGPFALSRNPIYLAMSVMYLGLAVIANSAWVMLLFPVLHLLMYWGVIKREEDYLTEKFGAPFKDYRAKVRRWI